MQNVKLERTNRSFVEETTSVVISMIAKLFGGTVPEDLSRWCVANGMSFYRIPNRFYYVSRKVAETLHVPLVDMRTRTLDGDEIFICNPQEVSENVLLLCDETSSKNAHGLSSTLGLYGASNIVTLSVTSSVSSEIGSSNDWPLDGEVGLYREAIEALLGEEATLFRKRITTLTPEHLFQVYEYLTYQGTSVERWSENMEILQGEVSRLHTAQMSPLDLGQLGPFKVMLCDLDDTLADVLTPISREMAELLYFHLAEGETHVVIQSLQPIDGRGLKQHFIDPLVEYIRANGRELSPLQRLHLLGSQGVVGYRMREDGALDPTKPLYDYGLTATEWKMLEHKIHLGATGRLAKQIRSDGGFFILYFESEDVALECLNELDEELQDFRGKLKITKRIPKDPRKHVVHIRPLGATKMLGREYVLNNLRREIERETGNRLDRSSILVMGDRMGVSPGQSDDSEMFILGAVNIALGREAIQGAYRKYMNTLHHGATEVLNALKQGALRQAASTEQAR